MAPKFIVAEYVALVLLGYVGLLCEAPALTWFSRNLWPQSGQRSDGTSGQLPPAVRTHLLLMAIVIPVTSLVGLVLSSHLKYHDALLTTLLGQAGILEVARSLGIALLVGLGLGVGLSIIQPPETMPRGLALLSAVKIGLTDEILWRWFALTLVIGFVTLAVTAVGRSLDTSTELVFWIANISIACLAGATAVSQLFFISGLFNVRISSSTSTLAFVSNAATAIAYGYLYWHVGIEAAMLAHLLASVVPPLRPMRALKLVPAAERGGQRLLTPAQAVVPVTTPAGAEGLQIMDTPSVQHALARLLDADDEKQRQILVTEQRALLSPACDTLLDEDAARARARHDRARVHRVSALRAMLFEARALGIDRAWNTYAGMRTREQAAFAKAERRRQEEEERKKHPEDAAAAEEKRLAEEKRASDELWKRIGGTTPNPNDHPWERIRTIYKTGPQDKQSPQLSWHAAPSSGPNRRPNPGWYKSEVALLWLRQTNYRDQRRCLEHHLELMSDRGIVELRQITIGMQVGVEDLTRWLDSASLDYPALLGDVQEQEELLLECRRRGGSPEAIRDAYVNRHGGFTLDGPMWVEELTNELDQVPLADAEQFATRRVARLRTALGLVRGDPSFPKPTLAELYTELAGSLRRLPEEGASTRVEQIQLLELATAIYTREDYPLQWLRTQVALVATQAASRIAHATHADGPILNTANDWVSRGELNARDSKWVDAAACFTRATQLDSELLGAWTGLADSYRRLGLLARALAAGARAMALQPDNAATWALLGALYLEHSRYIEALAAYGQSLRGDETPVQRWHGKAESLFGLNRFQDAVAVYDLILIKAPDDFIAWNNKGNNLLKMGEREAAVSAFDMALELKPDSGVTWHIRGEALAGLEKDQTALYSFNQALQFNPQVPQTWYQRGEMLRKLDRPEEAILSFETAVDLDPTYFPAWNALRRAFRDLGRDDEEEDATTRMMTAR